MYIVLPTAKASKGGKIMVEINKLNGVSSVNHNLNFAKNATPSFGASNTAVPQMNELQKTSLGPDLVKEPFFLMQNQEYPGKTFDVQALGDKPIRIVKVTEDNIGEFEKFLDIWYDRGEEGVRAAEKEGLPNPRFLHPEIGGTMQFYDPVPFSDPYVTKDPVMIDLARKNGLTVFNEKGEECFLNRYQGALADIEGSYTVNGKLLDELGGIDKVGGVKGEVYAIKASDMKVALLPIGSKVKPRGQENLKIVGIGDVVCCAAKNGKAKNDWYVVPVKEFLKNAKENVKKGNVEFIDALRKFDALGRLDAAEWAKILKRFA